MKNKLIYLFQDWRVNHKNSKGQIVMVLYRIASLATINKYVFYFLIPYLFIYRILIEWILGIELPYKVKIGRNLNLIHGQSLVINKSTSIGCNCIIRQSTTIGNKQLKDGTYSNCPVIGNNVDIGANVCIIGPIIIGDNVKIGAGTVVVKNIPSGSIVVGNPARIVNKD